MLDAIATPFGWLMRQFYALTGNFGLAVILFSLAVTIVLLPFMAKSKKGMMRMTRLQPKLMELQKKHEGNQQKLNEEIAKLYRQEKASPMGGCLWTLLPFPILLALYRAVIKPLTIVMGVPDELLAEGGALLNRLNELGFSLAEGANSYYAQIYQSEFITANFDQFAGISDKLIPMDFNFLGLNLAATPNWHFWAFDFSEGVWPVIGLFLIPIISTALSYLSMYISQKVNATTATTAQAQSTNRMMVWMMPLMSLWLGFTLPAAMGIYWIMNSITGIIRDTGLTAYYKKKLDAEDAVRRAEEREREEELERKRQETERLRAMNATTVNKNTSKKKQQAQAAQANTERKAAAEREERAARRERRGVKEEEKPASQVGNRRYARGRAYVADRFTNPEGAEEATAAAAAESEFGESIDPDVPEAVETAARDESQE